ncbi:tetratricopeptide repeat protein [Ekhidna sp.]|jgi:tetratricopeptide (TPR) repeat protein|uniref:tetratricopeptide repeat protein n=1 Tax=Ekhidna sp. TaxID=2608089 RepID=UPI0032EEAA6C
MKYIVYTLILLFTVACNTQDSISGDDYFDDEEYVKAIDAYTSYLATHPDHVKSLYNRGRSYEEVGKTEEAIKDFEAIIDLDPKNINAYLSLAKISYNTKEYSKVLVYSGAAIDLNENMAQAHFLAGRAEHQLGYFDQAMESYNNAIAINRDFGEAYLYRGAVKVGKEQFSSACEDFRFAKSLDVPEADKAIKDYCK